MLGISPLAGALCCLSWLVFAAAFRMSSLAALLMVLVSPLWLWLAGSADAIWAVVILIVLIWVKHSANIGRLMRGEEPKIGGR